VAIKSFDLMKATENNKQNSLLTPAVRWDDKLERVAMMHRPSDPYITFYEAPKIIQKLCTHKQVIIEFGWFYKETIHFKFDLTGAADIIWKVKNEAASQKGEGAIPVIDISNERKPQKDSGCNCCNKQ